MQATLQREGWVIGRDQTARLMKLAGVRGVSRSPQVYATKSDPKHALPGDKVERWFSASAPKRLLVCDITCVATWSRFAYVSFVTDVYSCRIVGWNVASTVKADVLPLQALEMAAWQLGGDLEGAIDHSDHGSNYMATVYASRGAELGAIPSTGIVGDSYDNALVEAVNGLDKTELVRVRGSWETVEEVELATLEWVWWWNHARLHGELGMCTPIEIEEAYYAETEPLPALTR